MIEFKPDPEAVYSCSFCFKKQNEVKVLLFGGSAMICEECVGQCCKALGDILTAIPADTNPQPATPTPEDTAAPQDGSSSEPSHE